MRRPPLARAAAFLTAVITALTIAASAALAGPADYRFEAIQPHVKAGGDTIVAVRLIHLPDNKPVKDAVIFSSKMVMPMEGMKPMLTKVTAEKPSTPGEYPFRADLSMEGPWNLELAAKVQGERGTVTGTVPFMAMP